MDSNSNSYLILVATVVLLSIVFAVFSGIKRKTKMEKQLGTKIQPFELKTTHLSQLLTYLWFPLLINVPLLIFKKIHPPSYFIVLLVLMVVFMAWFISAHHAIERENEDE